MTKKSISVTADLLSAAVANRVFGGDEDHSGIHKKITCFQIVKGTRAKVDFTYTAPDGTKFNGDLSPDNDIHQDMKDCLTKLIPHLIEICEQKERIKDSDIESTVEEIAKKFNQYSIDGFKIKGNGEDESVSIFGSKLLKRGAIGLSSPGVFSQSDYIYASELFELIETCKYEAEKYLNGKFSVKQQVMDFDQMETSAAE